MHTVRTVVCGPEVKTVCCPDEALFSLSPRKIGNGNGVKLVFSPMTFENRETSENKSRINFKSMRVNKNGHTQSMKNIVTQYTYLRALLHFMCQELLQIGTL